MQVCRSGRLESEHYGHVVVYDQQGLSREYGSAQFQCYTRSIIKPIQAKVSSSFIQEGLADKFLAIACASHNATEEQLKVLHEFSTQMSIDIASLRCGCDAKFPGAPIYHNCAGKHLAMLCAAKSQGWSLDNYFAMEHPLQNNVAAELNRLLTRPESEQRPYGIDGCGLPTFYLSLEEMGKLFFNLIIDPAYQKIIEVMNQYPQLIGGPKQIDTTIMQSQPGKFIAKGGAEGLLMIANLVTKQVLVIKISDGANRAKPVLAARLLQELGWLDLDIDTSILNAHGVRVGDMI